MSELVVLTSVMGVFNGNHIDPVPVPDSAAVSWNDYERPIRFRDVRALRAALSVQGVERG